ncbi:23776_t:CDS:2, partial [Racocetra persica]
NQVAEIPISYDRNYPFFEDEEKFEYENKVLNEAKSFYTKKLPSNKPDPEDEPLEQKLEKSIDKTHLTLKQRQEAKNFLNNKKTIFVCDTNNLNQTNLMIYEIDIRRYIVSRDSVRPDKVKLDKIKHFSAP